MTITVLLVDDEPSNIDIMRGILPDNIKIKAATSGELALRIATKAMPDIIFMDVQMPSMSGIETSAKLRQLPGGDNVKIVYVSGSELTASSPQENGFLLKPIDNKSISQILHEFFA
jgi:putative two-component system response regulator